MKLHSLTTFSGYSLLKGPGKVYRAERSAYSAFHTALNLYAGIERQAAMIDRLADAARSGKARCHIHMGGLKGAAWVRSSAGAGE